MRRPTLKRTESIDAVVFDDINDLAYKGAIYQVPIVFDVDELKKVKASKLAWHYLEFPPANKMDVPKEPGVYAFVIMPDIFNLSQVSSLLYVGMTKNFYNRIGAYLGEINSRFSSTVRPRVWRMLNVWHGHLRYYYTITADEKEAVKLEDEMLAALVPPMNGDLPATIGKKMKAFK